MLASITKEKFEEWSFSDELDGTISGIDRLTWTVANAAADLLSAQIQFRTQIKPSSFVPGAVDIDAAASGQSPSQQRAEFEKIAAIQNASMR